MLKNGHHKCSAETIMLVNVRGSAEVGNNAASVPTPVVHNTIVKTNLAKVEFEGGSCTAKKNLVEYGFNVDWRLLEVLEYYCRDIESSRIPEGNNKWEQYTHTYHLHPLSEWWKSPNNKYVNCKVLEIGCDVGVYADVFKKENAKRRKTVIGIEINPMGRKINRGHAEPK